MAGLLAAVNVWAAVEADRVDAGGAAASAVEEMDAPWARHTITNGPRGADGVHLADIDDDGFQDVTTAWEEAGLVTVSLHPGPGAVAGPWRTVTVGTRLHGVEDAVFADVDLDGNTDVVAACECRKVVVYFGPERSRILDPDAWLPVVITGAATAQRWIKVAVADVDDDGRPDIVGGGKVSPATIGWFRGPDDPRDPAAWQYTVISEVGWTMSLIPMRVDSDDHVDLVVSDRTSIRKPDGTVMYELRGTRWVGNPGGRASWVNHPIGFARGEHRFVDVVDADLDGVVDDVVDTAFAASQNRITVRRNLDRWLSWAPTAIPPPSGVGRIQHARMADLDLDEDLDLVLSHSHADGELSGVVWLAAGPDQTWQRGEISGAPGLKFDNVELYDLDLDGDQDVLTSEQKDQLGIVWYENPTRSRRG